MISIIRDISRQLLDRVVERGEVDVEAEYSVPLPMKVLAAVIGIPPEDQGRIFEEFAQIESPMQRRVKGELAP